jgi:NDP-sugar pyrophosphorylase family protein
MDVRTAGIIAAGQGTRFRDAGLLTPKPLIPVAGVPLIRRLLGLLELAGIQKVHCIIHEGHGAIQDYVEALDLKLEVRFVRKSTASSMHSLFELAPDLSGVGAFLLATVDAIAPEDEFCSFLEGARRDRDADGILACTQHVQDENPLWIGVDPEHRIVRFSPPPNEAQCVTGGLYVLRSEIFDEMQGALLSGTQRLRNFLSRLLEAGYKLRGYHFSKIVDVDDPIDLLDAESLLRQPRRSTESS